MRIDCKTYLEVDEIDHLTIRVRRGEPLDRKTAVGMIRHYAVCDAAVKAALAGTDVSLAALEAASDEDIYGLLIQTRTALIDQVL